MPVGRYTILGDNGSPVGTEAFRCAPGPLGWRYVSEIETTEHGEHRETVDVTVDAAWRIARLRIETGQHGLLLEPRGETLAGSMDGEPLELPWGPDDHLDYLTPVTNLITTGGWPGRPRSTSCSWRRPRSRRAGSASATSTSDPRSSRPPSAGSNADRWRYTGLDSGWTSDLWVAGDVVVRYERIFELAEYEAGASGPPVL